MYCRFEVNLPLTTGDRPEKGAKRPQRPSPLLRRRAASAAVSQWLGGAARRARFALPDECCRTMLPAPFRSSETRHEKSQTKLLHSNERQNHSSAIMLGGGTVSLLKQVRRPFGVTCNWNGD